MKIIVTVIPANVDTNFFFFFVLWFIVLVGFGNEK